MTSGDDSQTDNLVEIVDSGTIEVIEGESEDDDDEEGDEGEGELYNTDVERYRQTLSDGDSITVSSS